jgi:hypothetical protein
MTPDSERPQPVSEPCLLSMPESRPADKAGNFGVGVSQPTPVEPPPKVDAPHSVHPHIAFIHIPKCGGTTISRYLVDLYGARRSASVGRRTEGALLALDEPHDLWVKRTSGRRLMYGHVTWPKLSDRLNTLFTEPFGAMTIVRDPLERAISEYQFVLRTPRHVRFRVVSRMSPEQFLIEGHGPNRLCQFIGGSNQPGAATACLDTIQRQFVAVGVLHELSSFVTRLGTSLRVPAVDLPCFNASPTSSVDVGRRIPPSIQSRFRDANQDDYQIFQWVLDNWRDHWRLAPPTDAMLPAA